MLLHPRWRSGSAVAVVLASGPVLVAAGIGAEWPPLACVGLGVIVCCVRSMLIRKRGFTRTWPDGLENRLVGPRAWVAWEHVERLVLVSTVFGRLVQVEKRDGSRITLAAPRSGPLMNARDYDIAVRRIQDAPGAGRAGLRAERGARG